VRGLRFAYHNNCPRCPIISAEDIPGDEFLIGFNAVTSGIRRG
jgi:hypothetical protein